jgi:hypothetical protein
VAATVSDDTPAEGETRLARNQRRVSHKKPRRTPAPGLAVWDVMRSNLPTVGPADESLSQRYASRCDAAATRRYEKAAWPKQNRERFSELYPPSVSEEMCAKRPDVIEKLVIVIFPKTDCGGKCWPGANSAPGQRAAPKGL